MFWFLIILSNESLKPYDSSQNPTMRPVKVHKPVRMNSHDFQSLMNCILIGKTPGAVICLIQVDSKGFSCPDILNF